MAKTGIGEVTTRAPSRPPITCRTISRGSLPLSTSSTAKVVRVKGVPGAPSTTREPRETTSAMRCARRAAWAVVSATRSCVRSGSGAGCAPSAVPEPAESRAEPPSLPQPVTATVAVARIAAAAIGMDVRMLDLINSTRRT